MKNILIVDDERPFLLSLQDGLCSFNDQFKVILAGDGREAVKVLRRQPVDLLVTDLKLPIMDGFQLLAYVSRFDPYLPVIVMTAFGTPEIEERLAHLNALHYMEKPLDLDALTGTIQAALAKNSGSYIRGVTLATFLQLVRMEQRSCSLKIRSGGKTGYLFIRQGELLDAQTGSIQGEAAALQIIAWDDSEIEMDNICRRNHQNIESSLDFVLMEAYRIKDEVKHPEPFLAGSRQAARSPVETAARPPKKPVPDESLLEALRKSSVVREFAIFDDANFLEHQSEDPCSLSKFDPTHYLAMCQTVGQKLGKGSFRYLMFSTAQQVRYMVLQSRHRRVVLSLNKAGKPSQVFDQLNANLFSPRQPNGGAAIPGNSQ